MVVAGIATSVIRGYNTMKDDSGAVSIIVSYSPDNSTIEQSESIYFDVFLM